MPPTIRSPKLDSRNARAKLPSRSAPYFVKVHQGLQLGYAKGSKGGSWIGRHYIRNKQYEKQKLGLADDLSDADGLKILDFWQAQEAVKAWAEHRRLADTGITRRGPYSVADAISDYLAHLASTKGPKAEADGRSNAMAHILEPLGAILINDLTADRITKWHRTLASSPKLIRTKTNARARATRPTPEDADAHRKRRARANRVLTVLKAALNHAFHTGKAGSDQAWRRVKPFARVDVAVIRHLSCDEIVRLTDACEPAFRTLVHGALLTGCRYGELTRLRVANVNLETGIATVREGKGGKPRHVVLTAEAMALFRMLGSKKEPEEAVFLRADGKPWGASHQRRPLIKASTQAGIMPAVSFHILRHTHASLLAMRGVPLGVIAAQLGHADTRMTEKHYAHLAPSYVADTIRANFPTIGAVSDSAATGGNIL